jgi:hypothetical protein
LPIQLPHVSETGKIAVHEPLFGVGSSRVYDRDQELDKDVRKLQMENPQLPGVGEPATTFTENSAVLMSELSAVVGSRAPTVTLSSPNEQEMSSPNSINRACIAAPAVSILNGSCALSDSNIAAA